MLFKINDTHYGGTPMQQFNEKTFLSRAQGKTILIDNVSIMRKEFEGKEVGFDSAYDEPICTYKSEFVGKVSGVISMHHGPDESFVPEFAFNFTWAAKGKEDSYDGAYDFTITPIMFMVNVSHQEDKNTPLQDVSPFVIEFIESMAWEYLVMEKLPKIGVDRIHIQRTPSPGLSYINEKGELSYTRG